MDVEELKARIYAAADTIEPGLGARIAGMQPGAAIRSLVNEITGAQIQNGPIPETFQALAEAMERTARERSPRPPAPYRPI